MALVELKVRERVISAEGVFREAAAEYPVLSGMDYRKVGSKGAAPATAEAKA